MWRQLRYRTTETWLDEGGTPFRPYTHYCVGGNTKFWGTVMYRLRPEDFGALEHEDGVSPAWPIDYATLAPYYDRAEQLYGVHGEAGVDPTEGPRGPYPYPPVPHARVVGDIVERLKQQGLHPSPLPLGLQPNCILCNTCNSFPCKIHAKSDAEVCGIRPATTQRQRRRCGPTRSARRLFTDASGKRVEAVEVERGGETMRVSAPLVIVSCGAVNSAALLLRSANDKHPDGLANSSGLVGRRYMAHLATMMQGFHPVPRQRHGVPEDRGDQRLLLQGTEQPLPARPDPVAGPHARRDGADGGAAGAGVGLRRVGGAGRRLAGDDRRPAARREPRDARRRAARSGCTTSRTTCARTSSW